MQKLKHLILGMAAVLTLLSPALAVGSVYAAESTDIQGNLCAGANLSVDATCPPGGDTEATTKINSLLSTVINIFSLIVGVIAVIMIIIGGLRYITSGGDSGNVTAAKNTILYAIIGLVVVALAQFIVRFVLAKVTQ
jgi:cytochrome bd-type quinol oxidase subunit 2